MENIQVLVPKDFYSNSLLYVARGHPGNRWHQNEKKEWVLRDEYAENLPEALLKLCIKTGWKLVVVFAGKAPEFSKEKPSYSTRYPLMAAEIDFDDIGFPIGVKTQKALRTSRAKELGEQISASSVFMYRGLDLSRSFHSNLDEAIKLSASFYGAYQLWYKVFPI